MRTARETESRNLQVTSVTLEPRLRANLRALARKRDMSASAIVRVAVKEYLARAKAERDSGGATA